MDRCNMQSVVLSDNDVKQCINDVPVSRVQITDN